jgi:hypothetical protein
VWLAVGRWITTGDGIPPGVSHAASPMTSARTASR